MMMQRVMLRSLLVLFCAGLVLAGCKSTASYYLGYKADAKNIVPLSTSGPIQDTWKTFNLSLDYQAKYEGKFLDISGTAKLSDFYGMNANRLSELDLFVFFTDNDDKVIETNLLARALGHALDQELTFTKRLAVPTTAKSFAFGYSGETTGDGGVRGKLKRDTFYELPKKNPR